MYGLIRSLRRGTSGILKHIITPGEGMENEVTLVRDGTTEVRFEESDVRRACSMMLCGDHVDDCIALVKQGNMSCALCYAVLQARRKPFRICKRNDRN